MAQVAPALILSSSIRTIVAINTYLFFKQIIILLYFTKTVKHVNWTGRMPWIVVDEKLKKRLMIVICVSGWMYTGTSSRGQSRIKGCKTTVMFTDKITTKLHDTINKYEHTMNVLAKWWIFTKHNTYGIACQNQGIIILLTFNHFW